MTSASAEATDLRVLLVEPKVVEVERICEILAGASFFAPQVKAVRTFDEAVEILEDNELSYDVMLVDISTPFSGAVEALEEGLATILDIPIIALSAIVGEEHCFKIVARGAQECIPLALLQPSNLERVIRYAIERHRLVSTLRELSLVDPLTCLYNRRAFFTLGKRQLKLALRTQTSVTLYFIDMDGLKKINDERGHAVGDKYLLGAAEVFKETFRESDLVARIGGDEFAALAVEAEEEGEGSIESRLVERVKKYNSTHSKDGGSLSLSVGKAICTAGNTCTLEALLSAADRKMYEVKKAKKASQG
ncbi:MAG: hypothetical protein C0608_04120 [Deltaproteobacteria bacterium]|nr:MAG: hypothetical protein C0608_04120 [Deltaproteobacteria bacterium]